METESFTICTSPVICLHFLKYSKSFFFFFCRRSRDVAKLYAEMSFDTNKINVQQPTCQIHGKDTVCVKTRVCFRYHIQSKTETNPETCETFHISVLNPPLHTKGCNMKSWNALLSM